MAGPLALPLLGSEPQNRAKRGFYWVVKGPHAWNLLFPGWQAWAEPRKFPAPVGPFLVPALPVWRSPWLGHAQGPQPALTTISPFPSAPPSLTSKSHLFLSPHPTPDPMQVWITHVF